MVESHNVSTDVAPARLRPTTMMPGLVLYPPTWRNGLIARQGKAILYFSAAKLFCAFSVEENSPNHNYSVGLSQNVMNLLGYSDAAQLQRRSTDAVTELVLRCCDYWPNRLGWRQKVLQPPSMFMLLSWWCPLGHDKRRQSRFSLRFDWYQFWPTSVPAGQYGTFKS
jgi:hypothetical protein